MDYKVIAKKIVRAIGGEANIEHATHCMSRLRFTLKDYSKANDDEVESISGVKGVMKQGGQYQIIIGGEVSSVYRELPEKLKNVADVGGDVKNLSEEKNIKTYLNAVFDYISGSLTAALPAIIGCGMVKLILVIMGLAGLDGTQTYEVIDIIGDAGFYFLPIILAYTSAKKLNTNIVLAMVVSAVLIHPALIEAMAGDTGLAFLGIPIFSTGYTSAVIPPLLATWVLSFILPLVDKVTPGWSKAIFQPLLALIITIPVVLIIFAPLGAIIGIGLTKVTEIAQQVSPGLTMMILAALMPLLIITGMHHAFDPIWFANFAAYGFDGLFLPIMLCTNFAIGAACLAVALKTKNKNFRSIAVSSAISGSIAGITEPGLFGVLVRLKRPMAAVMIGSGAAGLLVGLLKVEAHAIASPGLLSMIQFIAPDSSANLMNAVIVAVVATVISFAAVFILGFKDLEAAKEKRSQKDIEKLDEVAAPINGRIVELEHVKDATFAKKLLGDGIAIEPSEGKVYAPADGEIKAVFQTGHAIGMETSAGDELLLHIGIDTVKLEGEGFSPKVEVGNKVRKGELLLEFDLAFIKEQGYDVTTPIVVTNAAEKEIVNRVKHNDKISEGEALLDIVKRGMV